MTRAHRHPYPTPKVAKATGGVPTPVEPLSPGLAGTSLSASRTDHKHALNVGVPAAVGTANAQGSSQSLSRSDHVHAERQVDVLILRKAANQLFTSGVEATVAFDTVVEVTSPSIFSASAGVVTVSAAGLFDARASCKWAPENTGYRTLHVWHTPVATGVAVLLDDDHRQGGPDVAVYWVSNAAGRVVRLAVGDTIHCTAMTVMPAAGTLNMLGQNPNSPWLSLVRLGA